MPFEVGLLAAEWLQFSDLVEFGLAMRPSLRAQEEMGGGLVTFRRPDSSLALALTRPKRVEDHTDLANLLTPDAKVPSNALLWIEGSLPFAIREGRVLLLAIADELNGVAVFRGVDLARLVD